MPCNIVGSCGPGRAWPDELLPSGSPVCGVERDHLALGRGAAVSSGEASSGASSLEVEGCRCKPESSVAAVDMPTLSAGKLRLGWDAAPTTDLNAAVVWACRWLEGRRWLVARSLDDASALMLPEDMRDIPEAKPQNGTVLESTPDSSTVRSPSSLPALVPADLSNSRVRLRHQTGTLAKRTVPKFSLLRNPTVPRRRPTTMERTMASPSPLEAMRRESSPCLSRAKGWKSLPDSRSSWGIPAPLSATSMRKMARAGAVRCDLAKVGAAL
mmetsp:Transcript_4609/g.19636  ORF Transcript_4609/g.19636 Transcript_4609/m.19636 type:complete len:270 (-) Transcript_4609:279-1088(-)